MQGALSKRLIVAAAISGLICATLLALQAGGSPADAAPAAETAAKKKKKKGKKKTYSIKRKTFRMSVPNDGQRMTVMCPGKSEPLGGGMTTQPPAADGEGIYPHSYERLGRQSGYHITPILYDPSPGSTQARSVTLSVLCGPKYAKVTPPHHVLNLGPQDRKTATATCPGKRYLIGGGYQRTNFTHLGGIYATESRAISPKAWRVEAIGLGRFGGEAVAIGYCVRAKKPPMKEVTATTTVEPRSFATATTPNCPKGRRIAFGGYSSPIDGSVLSTGGDFAGTKAWKVGGYNTSRTVAGTITAYGYCLKL